MVQGRDWFVVLALLLNIVLLGCSSAEGPAAPPLAFERSDANHDGGVTLEEWRVLGAETFEALDKNHDDFIAPEEFREGFDQFDQDGSGTITADEAPTIVQRADSDGDDVVTRKEFESQTWSGLNADLDADNRVSRDEFRKSRRRIFDEFDRDRDQTILPPEIDDQSRFTIFRF